jgi:glycosyltransferase involved in cell wall biosynthesis
MPQTDAHVDPRRTQGPGVSQVRPGQHIRATEPLRVGLFYDMDACHSPTGVTRHALAQLERLTHRPEIALRVLSGRINQPDGTIFWESLPAHLRQTLPLRTRDILRWWRVQPWPSIEWWSGLLDWVYCPAEFFVPSRSGRLAITSHDVLQTLQFEPARKRNRLGRIFEAADLILSVSQFNTERLLEAFPSCRSRVVYVPNGAEDLFFEEVDDADRAQVRFDLDLPAQMPYLLSVANFQPRKNLVRLIRAALQLPEVANGHLAVVLIGTGADHEVRLLNEAATAAGSRVLIRTPGYRQGRELRAIYAEATALVFPSLCESFGIPAVEAMAQGVPIALADSSALPEIGGEAGWYFDPLDEDAITSGLRSLLDDHQERARRAKLGKTIAAKYRWDVANDLLVEALLARTQGEE